jgi:hypothetical protein
MTTAHALRSGTKSTKLTKTTKCFCKKIFVRFVVFVGFVPAFAAKPLRRDLAVARANCSAGGGGPEREPWLVSVETQL